ncbi:stage V sporulation protein AD [Anaerovorax odorimutans]|uniref:Stage V sporulation protein AD n=1 Tax=Anaerovorax odorimutans TaxID=109327 RepID=A0ABT1RRW1_9FIRM|nr:stage V sporulation protein AD [Anaerovorax odorimutans]MCQ4637939.1 stage V sporulation protein AD [Anaerovorax odorimutans]
MIKNKMGNQTLTFSRKPVILSAASVVGKKEGEGPLSQWFDTTLEDDTFGEKTWEKSESKMLKTAMTEALRKSGRSKEDIGAMLSGDLLNQLMSSSFMARDMHIPFLGMYGACSTMTESLMLGAVLTDGQYSDNVIIGASSHYCTAERQFRMPLEHGNQRPPCAQWTATAAGAMVLSSSKDKDAKMITDEEGNTKTPSPVCVDCGTIGKVIDAGIKDANQMGAAMAPAAVDTLLNHFSDTGRDIDYYDLILTGDLGYIGKDIAKDLLVDAGLSQKSVDSRYDDCGAMIFIKEQDVHGGGSGCGCSASVFSSYVYKRMQKEELRKVLIISTGALLSTISPFQGESIPGIAHAIALETGQEGH